MRSSGVPSTSDTVSTTSSNVWRVPKPKVDRTIGGHPAPQGVDDHRAEITDMGEVARLQPVAEDRERTSHFGIAAFHACPRRRVRIPARAGAAGRYAART
jgi:hypothetical protein